MSRFDRVRDLVVAARELDPRERRAWLDDACGDDGDLRREVESLLAHDSDGDHLLRTGGAIASMETLSPDPERVGPYLVREKIGEGGFGDVFAAEQHEPIRRDVAVKLLKRGMDTRAVLARFAAERQVLALLEHPNIARIVDAGEADDGRPYFVMDLIDGPRLTTYTEGRPLDERLSLMAEVTDAVAHAHRRGVVHRDLKPSNILVATIDGRATPKIIDFGIAKAMDARVDGVTWMTAEGQVLGTPSYMSPEQAAGEPVGEASDIYSLGAVLYELIAGRPPLEADRVRGVRVDQVHALIVDHDPKPPSALAPGVPSDVDRVVLRAIAKRSDARYPSAEALAADLRRLVAGDAVSVAEPGAGDRVHRLVHRARRRIARPLAGAIARTGLSVRLALQARQLAEERNRATREQESAERVADFLSNMLASIEPSRLGAALWGDLRTRLVEAERRAGRSDDDIARSLAPLDRTVDEANPTNVALRLLDEEILAKAARTIDDELGADPVLAARLYTTVGTTYREFGLFDRAAPHLQRALADRERLLGAAHPDTIDSLTALAVLRQKQDRLDEAEALTRDAVDRASSARGTESSEYLAALTSLGSLLAQQGKADDAERIRREAVDGHRRLLGDRHLDTLTAIGNLGQFLTNVGRHDEAEGLMRECLDGARSTLGDDAPLAIGAANNLAMLYAQTGRFDDAEPLMRDAVAGYRRIKGDDHLDTIVGISNLATIYDGQEAYAEAERALDEAYRRLARVAGDSHLYTLAVRQNLGTTQRKLGRLDEAAGHLEATVAANREHHGPDHPHTLNAMGHLADTWLDMGRDADAERLLVDAVTRAERSLPDTDWITGALQVRQATVWSKEGRIEAARELLGRAIGQFRRTLGDDNERTRDAERRLAALD